MRIASMPLRRQALDQRRLQSPGWTACRRSRPQPSSPPLRATMMPKQRPMANASASDSVRPTVPRMSYSRSVVGSNRWRTSSSDRLARDSGHDEVGRIDIVLQEGAHRIRQIGALQRVGDLRLQEADLVAAVESLALVAQAMERLLDRSASPCRR